MHTDQDVLGQLNNRFDAELNAPGGFYTAEVGPLLFTFSEVGGEWTVRCDQAFQSGTDLVEDVDLGEACDAVEAKIEDVADELVGSIR